MNFRGLLPLVALALGCSSTQPVANDPVGKSDVPEDPIPNKPVAPAGPAELSIGDESGNAIIGYPSFQVMEDGRSLISLQVQGPVRVVEKRVDGALVYSLVGISIPESVNQLPLPTEFFPSPVSAVEVRQAAQGAELVISLREPARGILSLRQADGGTLLTVEVPRSLLEADLAPRRVNRPEVSQQASDNQDGGDSWNGNLSRSIVGPRSPGLIVLGAVMTSMGIAGLSAGAYLFSQEIPACDRLLDGFTLVQEDPLAAAEMFELSDLGYEDCESEIIVKGAGALSLATGAAFFLAGVPVLLVGAISTEKTIKLGVKVYPAAAGLLLEF